MVKGGRTNALNAVRRSRQDKARMFMRDRATFFAELIAGIERAQRKAKREGLKLCVRLNGATDIAWEGVTRDIRGIDGRPYASVFAAFPDVQFVDYTKSVRRALRAASDPTWPKNYHLTFSRSETNEANCQRVLEAGGNVAVVFAGEQPKTFMDSIVIDGDQHDLRHLDAVPYSAEAFKVSFRRIGSTKRGVIIGLSPKGNRAKADRSGFVVRP
jgi:hypothetical protein